LKLYGDLRSWWKNVVILTHKKVILGSPLFDSRVDFDVFDQKIWVFSVRVLILR
jgi:hypothetical protein